MQSAKLASVSTVLVTGASGFFGGILKRRLLREGNTVVNIDLEIDEDAPLPGLTAIQGDLRDRELVRRTFAQHRFDAVYHAAAQLAHGRVDKHLLWTSNVDATAILAEAAIEAGVRPFVFLSSNCLWASDLGHPVNEETDPPAPIEIYGQSKLAAEQILQQHAAALDIVILRCPTIMDSGRLGLLAILYEFIDDGKTVWVVGDGSNRYQFLYADDLAAACIQASTYGRSDLFHIGSDNVKTTRQVYESVIAEAARKPGAKASRARVRSLPKAVTVAAMRAAHALKLSPLGPYHYQMIAESFVFDTARIKHRLGWSPTLTNEQMLLRAHDYYATHRAEIESRTAVSAHRKPAAMGIIRLLKWLS